MLLASDETLGWTHSKTKVGTEVKGPARGDYTVTKEKY